MGIRLGVQYLIEGLQLDRKSMLVVEFHFDAIPEPGRLSVVDPLPRHAARVLEVLLHVHATAEQGSRNVFEEVFWRDADEDKVLWIRHARDEHIDLAQRKDALETADHQMLDRQRLKSEMGGANVFKRSFA